MTVIENVYVQNEIFTTFFKCDLEQCKGACCFHGDGQTPVTNIEYIILNDFVRKRQKNIECLDARDGFFYLKVDSNGKCFFSDCEGDIAYCSLHGENNMMKPSYCQLFPLKLRKAGTFQYLTIERRSLCSSAFKENNILIWDFLSEYLIFQFGKKWYNDFTSVYYSQYAKK